jgi:hypothetical protein
MKLSRNKFVSIGAAGLLVAGAVAAAAPAFASGTVPSGCSASIVTPKLSGTKIHWGADATCNSANDNRDLDIDLYHNYDNWPDLSVDSDYKLGDFTSYTITHSECDGGTQTTQYYDTADFYNAVSEWKSTSATKTLTHC